MTFNSAEVSHRGTEARRSRGTCTIHKQIRRAKTTIAQSKTRIVKRITTPASFPEGHSTIVLAAGATRHRQSPAHSSGSSRSTNDAPWIER